MEWLGLMNFDKAKTLLYGWMEEKSNVSTMSEECLDVLQPRPNPNPRKPSTGSKFKGVLPQPNGNWGAQIYIKQQRIWLGTFRSEEEAAMAYDSASVLFRNAESPRNLSCTFDPVDEQQFQTLYCPKTILSMIKDGSYRARFDEFLRVKFGKNKTRVVGTEAINSLHHVGFSCRQLFQKELTPSDVGKLNRLVIPKKYAVKYLPKITEHDKFDGQVNGVDLLIYDQSMKSWCFRYCYWSSSQSYVFTKGWTQFVKEKGLKSNDIVTFYICERDGESRVFSMIGISRDDGENLYGFDGSGCSESRVRVGTSLDGSDADEKIGLESKVTETAVGFKLFGVQIN